MSDPIVTRTHRETALRAMGCEKPATADYVENFLAHGSDPSLIFPIARSVSEALATVEHARLEAEPKWILASAELPDSDVRVLVRGTDGDIVSAELEFTDDSEGHGEPYWAAGDCGDLSFCNYPHWMPRPADPPSGGPSDV